MDQPLAAFKHEAEVLVAQSVWLCNPMDCSPPGSSVHGILRTRILELLFPSPGDFPDQEIEPGSLALQVDFLPSESPGKPFSCLYWTFLAPSNSEQRAVSHHLIKSEHTHTHKNRPDTGYWIHSFGLRVWPKKQMLLERHNIFTIKWGLR